MARRESRSLPSALATSTDFPELTTFGDNREEAIARAVHALEEAIAARIHDRRGNPLAIPGAKLRHTADSDLGEGNALRGDEGPGHRQGGVGPSPWVAHAASGSCVGRSAQVAARPNRRCPWSHRPAVARDRRSRSYRRRKGRHALAAMGPRSATQELRRADTTFKHPQLPTTAILRRIDIWPSAYIP